MKIRSLYTFILFLSLLSCGVNQELVSQKEAEVLNLLSNSQTIPFDKISLITKDNYITGGDGRRFGFMVEMPNQSGLGFVFEYDEFISKPAKDIFDDMNVKYLAHLERLKSK